MSEIDQTAIDRSGKVRIPKAIRVRLGLSPGARLAIEVPNDEEIRLRPIREQPQLIDKAGVLVVQAVAVDKIEGIEKREREDRLAELTGQAGR